MDGSTATDEDENGRARWYRARPEGQDLMTDTDLLGRTPEEIERDRERFRTNTTRIRARDWREIPKGFYAIPIEDYSELFTSDDELPDDWKPPVIGYRLFERKVARVCQNGRVIGKDRFISGRIMAMPNVDHGLIREELASDERCLPDGWSYEKYTIDLIMLDVEGDDTYRATFGKLTGRCGCCGKTLTDPTSKLLGVGPDCRGRR